MATTSTRPVGVTWDRLISDPLPADADAGWEPKMPRCAVPGAAGVPPNAGRGRGGATGARPVSDLILGISSLRTASIDSEMEPTLEGLVT